MNQHAAKLASVRPGAERFFAPKAHAGTIERRAIVDALLGESAGATVVLQGPAGHGKTTLMQQLNARLSGDGVLTAWLTFEDADNDARRCFELLGELLDDLEDRAVPGRRLQEDNAPRADRFVQRLAMLGQQGHPVALFFDEFQALAESSIHAFFRELIARVPETVRIVIGSRTVPKLGLSRLVVGGDATLLRAEELRFSREELSELFQDDSLNALDDAQVETIYQRTDGWPAAVQLYRLAVRSQSIRDSLSDSDHCRHPQQLTDYLADNVLGLQSADLQQFLLRTALLKRMSPALCNLVTGRSDSARVLAELEQAGLFVRALDAQGQWFKYHTVFADFLRSELARSDPDAVTEIHAQAASWFDEQGLPEYALHHLMATRHYTRAARVLDRWASVLLPKAHLVTVERWLDRMPAEVVQGDPSLCVKAGWVSTFLRRQNRIGPLLEVIERNCAAQQPADIPHGSHVVASMIYILQDKLDRAVAASEQADVREITRDPFRSFELGAAANLLAFAAQARGEFEVAHDYLMLARAQGEASGTVFSWGYSVALLGVGALMRGQVTDALAQMQAGARDQRMDDEGSMASAALSAVMLDALYEANDLDALVARYDHFADIQDAALPDFLTAALIARARCHDARGEPGQAEVLLDRLATLGYASGWHRLIHLIGWERVRRELVAGHAERAHSIASRIAPAHPDGDGDWLRFNEDASDEVIGRIRLAIHDGRHRDALDRIREALPSAQQTGRTRREIRLLILKAMALAGDHDRAEAHGTLTQALELGLAGGFARSFIDEGECLARLLSAAVKSEAPHWSDALLHYARDLLRHMKGAADKSSEAEAESLELVDPLTEREEEIVTLVAGGASNKAAARQLFVSENTIKFHLKNIYSKLGVTSRLQAVQAARSLHLIE